MIDVRRAAQRYVTVQPGITSYHCFAAGPHYDPRNVGFGPLIGVDEHVVSAGAGFDRHAHRGVTIVSWVLEGVLWHEDAHGGRAVAPGELFVQHAGAGIWHVERNASEIEALRFVQTTVIGDDSAVRVIAQQEATVTGHVFVARGSWATDECVLAPGDSVRTNERIRIVGSGQLLLVDLP
jgi:redox-sensitive bicupin YhaK (pirin superfamily)